MPPALSPQAAPGSAQRGEGRGRLCPSIAGTGGDFCPIGVIPRWCDRTLPPRPEGPGSAEGHQRGCSIISPLALPRYSAVTGHAVAPSQPRCAVPDEEPRGTAASDNLRSTAAAGSPPPPRASRSAGTPIMGHPSRQLVTGVLPTALPWRHIPLRAMGLSAGIQARPCIPGHGHTSLGMATRPWGCNKHSSGHGGGYESIAPAQAPKSQAGTGTPATSPPGGLRASSPARPPHPGHRGDGGAMPERDAAGSGVPGLLPHRRDRHPTSALTPAPQQPRAGGRGSGPPSLTGDGSRAGEGGLWCSPGPPAQPPGAGLGVPRPLSRSASPSIPQLVAPRVPVTCPHPPHPGRGVPGGI